MKKRGMAALLALVMLLSCLPGIAWAQEDAGGAGTLPSEEEAVYIRSAEDWTAYAKDHEDGTATKTTLVLAEDIDLGELSVFLGSTSKKPSPARFTETAIKSAILQMQTPLLRR